MNEGGPGSDDHTDADSVRDLLVVESSDDVFERLFRDSLANAVIAWVFVGVLALALVESALDFDSLWLLFVASVAAVVLVPPVVLRSWRAMLPWELLVLALLPILARGLFGSTGGTFAVYLALAAVALVVVVELHLFTAMEVTHWFAVVLVVMATLASGAVWAVVRWTADQYLGTAYLTTNEALMTEFLWVTLAGFAAGVLFDAYFRRRDHWLGSALGQVVP